MCTRAHVQEDICVDRWVDICVRVRICVPVWIGMCVYTHGDMCVRVGIVGVCMCIIMCMR